MEDWIFLEYLRKLLSQKRAVLTEFPSRVDIREASQPIGRRLSGESIDESCSTNPNRNIAPRWSFFLTRDIEIIVVVVIVEYRQYVIFSSDESVAHGLQRLWSDNGQLFHRPKVLIDRHLSQGLLLRRSRLLGEARLNDGSGNE
jgi:hypothetical protein